jgi:hypothetical protein
LHHIAELLTVQRAIRKAALLQQSTADAKRHPLYCCFVEIFC